MPRTSDLGMDGLSGYLWLFVAVFGTVSVAVDSTLGFDELLMIEVMIG